MPKNFINVQLYTNTMLLHNVIIIIIEIKINYVSGVCRKAILLVPLASNSRATSGMSISVS